MKSCPKCLYQSKRGNRHWPGCADAYAWKCDTCKEEFKSWGDAIKHWEANEDHSKFSEVVP